MQVGPRQRRRIGGFGETFVARDAREELGCVARRCFNGLLGGALRIGYSDTVNDSAKQWIGSLCQPKNA